jgi:hypothetical protein
MKHPPLPQADGSSCTPMVVLSYVANGVALYNQLPQGAFTQDELVQLESLPTALDFLLPEDNGRWNLTFFRDLFVEKVCFEKALHRVGVTKLKKGLGSTWW